MNFISSLTTKYEQFWKNIIQPPRQEYSLQDLGPFVREASGTTILRKDLKLSNSRGDLLECSYFQPDPSTRNNKPLQFVVYLHGISGSRIEAMVCLQYLLPEYGVFCFDFSASGKSQGQYVTMGLQESDDLHAVVKFIKENLSNMDPIIWGRSMGAVTAILYAANPENQFTSGLILDSPFSDLKKAMQEIACAKTKIPKLLIDGAISLVRSKISDVLGGNDIFATNIVQSIQRIKCPVIFACASSDSLILPYHTHTLHDNCASEIKQLIEFEGNHNSMRPTSFYTRTKSFIAELMPSVVQQPIQQLKSQHLSSNCGGENEKGRKLTLIATSKQGSLSNLNIQAQNYHQISQKSFTTYDKDYPNSIRNNRTYNNNNNRGTFQEQPTPSSYPSGSNQPSSKIPVDYITQKQPEEAENERPFSRVIINETNTLQKRIDEPIAEKALQEQKISSNMHSPTQNPFAGKSIQPLHRVESQKKQSLELVNDNRQLNKLPFIPDLSSKSISYLSQQTFKEPRSKENIEIIHQYNYSKKNIYNYESERKSVLKS